jgi:hypothetical protein
VAQARYLVGLIVRSTAFDRLLLGFIVLSTGLLAYETYPAPIGATRATLDMLNLVCRRGAVCVRAQPRLQACPPNTQLPARSVPRLILCAAHIRSGPRHVRPASRPARVTSDPGHVRPGSRPARVCSSANAPKACQIAGA